MVFGLGGKDVIAIAFLGVLISLVGYRKFEAGGEHSTVTSSHNIGSKEQSDVTVFTQLSNGHEGGRIELAILGQVYDVTKVTSMCVRIPAESATGCREKHTTARTEGHPARLSSPCDSNAPGSRYGFFAGRDGSRAFITGVKPHQ